MRQTFPQSQQTFSKLLPPALSLSHTRNFKIIICDSQIPTENRIHVHNIYIWLIK